MKYNDIDFNDKSILITGGAGFIGSNIALYLQNNFPDSKILVFDSFRSSKIPSSGGLPSYGHYKNLIGFKGKIICGDITNKSDLKTLDEYQFDYIFHQAAISDTRNYNQEAIIRTNVNSFYDLIEIAIKNKAPIVYASSAATYGNSSSPQRVGIEEPDNPYGFSKLVMDQIASDYMNRYPYMTIVGLRFFNVYGPGEYYKKKTASMVIQLGHQILGNISPRLFRNSDLIYRDFIYIEDVVQANIKACSPKKSGVFNIGTGESRSFQEIADILQNELDSSLDIDYFENPFDGYQSNTKADITTSKEKLNFIPRFTLEEGIKAYIPEIKRLYGQKND